METIMSGAGQPVIVGHGKENGNCNDLVLSGHVHDASRHTDNLSLTQSLHNAAAQERFGLRGLEESAQIRKEMQELKHDMAVKVLEESHKTRELIRDQDKARMQDALTTLRAQLIAASIVPAE